MWRIATLVDSLDTLSTCVNCTRRHRAPLSGGLCEWFRVAKLIAEFGLVVYQHCSLQQTRIRSSRERDLSEKECWVHSTNAIQPSGWFQRSDWSPVCPTTLGTYNNWFRSYATSPRASATVLCGQDFGWTP